VLLDRSTLAVGPARLLRDLPTGAARLVWEQRGYKATIVNGEVLMDDGVCDWLDLGDCAPFQPVTCGAVKHVCKQPSYPL
jgi:hypothetical protein